MPTKTYDDASGQFLVEFRLPAEAAAAQAWLAGEFNDWSTDACPLVAADDGALSVVVPLAPGASYRFRYYLGDGAWENDWAADAYVDNEHGGSDSVVVVPDAGPPPPVASEDGEPPTASPAPAKEAPVKKQAAATKAAAAKTSAQKKQAPGVKKAAKKAAKKSSG